MPEVESPFYNNLKTNGWDNVAFNVPEELRAEYAAISNAVIDEALENDRVKEALELDIATYFETGVVRTGNFGIGYARNSTDKKVYLHTGFSSEEYAESQIPFRNQSDNLKSLWPLNKLMLSEVEQASYRVLDHLSASNLGPVLFPAQALKRNIHLRTVRYSSAMEAAPGEEVVSGHADIGMMSFHLYKTHGNWFHAAPYPASIVDAPNTSLRREKVREMRSRLTPITPEEDKATFFLGANWFRYPDVPERLRGLPACYHAGIRPPENTEILSPYASSVTLGKHDRVSVISFLHPDIERLWDGTYTPATVENCRPQYGEEN
jgi:hypothetical protein